MEGSHLEKSLKVWLWWFDYEKEVYEPVEGITCFAFIYDSGSDVYI